MKSKKEMKFTKIIVPCRFSYVNCFKPYSINGSEAKYSLSAIIPKTDTKTIAAIESAIEHAKIEAIAKWGGKIPSNLKTPLKDGDVERPEDEAYRGCYFFNANSSIKPQVVDNKVKPILNPNEVYSGCYGRISVNFYGYNVSGNRGIAAGLCNIQKIKDGERLGERESAEDEFDEILEEDFFA